MLRYTVAWVAGLSRIEWWRFLFWNAAGGIAWATAVGLTSYYAGQAAASAIQRYGLYAGEARGCNWWQSTANRTGAEAPKTSQNRCRPLRPVAARSRRP
ncbi:MAG: hypothetical protein E6G38_05690 [Actinobacteria bacterium]|nr:MAG: hypothetical protein E6G38_05690 [Actinomycetota bacterium]